MWETVWMKDAPDSVGVQILYAYDVYGAVMMIRNNGRHPITCT